MSTLFTTLFTLLAGLVVFVPAVQAQPIAEAGSWTLKLVDVDRHLAAKFHELRDEKIQELLIAHLLKTEGKARGIKPEEVIKQEIAKRVSTPSAREISQFIDANKDRLPNGGKGMEDRVRSYLLKQSEKKAQVEFMDYLHSKYGAKIYLKPPRFKVNGPQDLFQGKADAPITLIEFSDFECPYCARVQSTLKSVQKTYGDKIRLVFRHYPLPFHKGAPKAAEASQCAADQGQFWAFHDGLFDDQDDFTQARFEKLAATLKLDSKTFKKCLSSGRHAGRVAADGKEGQRLGISGTPTFFVNGIKLVGAVSLRQFQKTIDAELKAIK